MGGAASISNSSHHQHEKDYIDKSINKMKLEYYEQTTDSEPTRKSDECKLNFRDGIMYIDFSSEGDEMQDVPINLLESKIQLENNLPIIRITTGKKTFKMIADSMSEANRWIYFLRSERLFHTKTGAGHSLTDLEMFCTQYEDLDEETEKNERNFIRSIETVSENEINLQPPEMNIVILVVGTRGDVQPFVYLGQALKKQGHRVRLATHKEYRNDVVVAGGLEFYPLGGDPRKLSEYMVKTGGRLIPDLTNGTEMHELPEKMKMMQEICFSCFPACTAPDPEDPDEKKFLADAIISNPVSYGHIHCAEAICVPLHIMFPQPWSPTHCFPHPLSNLSFDSKWSYKNYISYKMVDEFMWIGLGGMINQFRKSILKLQPIRIGEHGDALLNDNKVPISHMWSPSFVPKCSDWPYYVDVVGEFRPANDAISSFQPHPDLEMFLNESDDKPLYVGFGSMVINDPTRLVQIVKESSQLVGCRILLQSGWTKYANDNERIAPNVMVIGAMPHDWLFSKVSAVVHHGGAGTTSAGLRAGNPTLICPFFGDQHFWAEMVYRSGAGPKGCPISELTMDIFVKALNVLRGDKAISCAKELGNVMVKEDGVNNAIKSFYHNLPLRNMLCEVSLFQENRSKIARIYCAECGLKMSEEVDVIIHRLDRGGKRMNHFRIPFRPAHWGVVGPHSVVGGIGQGMQGAAYELAGGIWDLFAKPIEGGYEGGVKGAAMGAAEGVKNFFARPIVGGKVLIECISTGASTTSPDYIESSLAKQVKKSQKTLGRTSFSHSLHDMANALRMNGGESNEVDKSVHLDDFDNEENYLNISSEMDGEEYKDLSDYELQTEKALIKAKTFLKLWNKIDKNKTRSIDEMELKNFFHDHEKFLDSSLTGESFKKFHHLTLTELIWSVVSKNSGNEIKKNSVRIPMSIVKELSELKNE